MSQVTDALKNLLQGYVLSTPQGAELARQQQASQELEAQKQYHQQSIDLEQQRLQEEQRVHDADIAYRKSELAREQMLARLARTTTAAQIAKLSPMEVQQIPGFQRTNVPVTGEEPTPPGGISTPPVSLSAEGKLVPTNTQGITGVIQGTEDEQGQPLTINAPSQEAYIANLRKESEAQRGPQLEAQQAMLAERLQNSTQLLEQKLNSALEIASNKNANALEVQNAKNEAAQLRDMLAFMRSVQVAQINQGMTGNFDTAPFVNQIKNGTISEDELKKQFPTKGQFNQIRNDAISQGYVLPTQKQRDLISAIGPAVEGMRQIQEFNDLRNKTGVLNTGALKDKQKQIGQALATAERELIKQRASNLQTGQILGYQPDIQDLAPGANTAQRNEDKLHNFAQYMNGLVDRDLVGLSPEQRANIKEATGINKYLPQGLYVGKTVTLKDGKTVTIKAIHKDGSFDAE